MRLVAASSSSLAIAWDASSPASAKVGATGYAVYLDGAKLQTVTETTYTFGGLGCGRAYTLAVAGFDASDNYSDAVAISVATGACPAAPASPPPPVDRQPPSEPGSFAKTSVTEASISVAWSASVDNVKVVGYTLYRDGASVGSTGGTSYSFSGLACGKSYALAVDAYDAAANHSSGTQLNVATAACLPSQPVDGQPPSEPGSFAKTSVTETSISVAWSASVDNVKVVGYTLYRDGAPVGSTGGTSYSFSGLACGKSYALAVDAYDAAANHSSRTQLNAATDACPAAPQPPPPGPAFYVASSGSDSNAGTLQSPWRTIGKAMASLGPGQIAYLRAGTYVEATDGSCASGYNTLVWSRSGSASAPIVISGYPGEESSVVVKTKLKLSGDWLVVRGLVVDRNMAYSSFDNACTGEPNVNVYGDDDVVQRLDIRNSNMSGIFLSGADRVRIEGNAIHDNGQHAALDHGIYYGSGVGGTITNNLIERNKAFGIQMYPHPSGQTISNNTIVGSGKAGMVLDGASGLIVANNIAAWNTEQGIRTGGSGCAGCTATTNVLFGNSADYYLPGSLAVLATIHADPMFLNRAAGDLRVDSTSPAVDAGLSSYAPATDFVGAVRPQGRGPDVGAYER